MRLLGHLSGRNSQQPREPDDGLSALLQQWQGAAPSPDFEAAVWRRLRRVPEPAYPASPLLDFARRWWPGYGWSTAAAAAVGIVAGVWLALAPGIPARQPDAAAPLLHSSTLAGSYVSMLAGGPP